MEIDDLKAAIEELNGEPAPYLTGFFVFKGIPNPILRRIDFAKEVSDDLANKFSSYLRNYLAKDEIVQGDLSTADGRQYDLLVYDIDLVNPLNQLQVVKDDPEQPVYLHSRDKDLKLDGFIFIVGNGDKELVTYKEFYPFELIARDSYLVFGREDSRFVEVTDEIYKISNKIDFVLFEDDLVVLNLKVLENKLNVHDVLKRSAVKLVGEFNRNNLLANPDKTLSRIKSEHWNEMMENSAESLAERDAVAKMEALFSNFRPLDHSVRDKIIASAEQKLEDIKEWRAKYKI